MKMLGYGSSLDDKAIRPNEIKSNSKIFKHLLGKSHGKNEKEKNR